MNVRAIYDGSDGAATKALYERLATRGAIGRIAMNLLRAQKCSARAKKYHGGIRGVGSYRSMAYERKDYSLKQLTAALLDNSCGMRWGWQRDEGTPGYEWVLYVELPQGQASFHCARRHEGHNFPGQWDGIRGVTVDRIVAFCESVLAGSTIDSEAPSSTKCTFVHTALPVTQGKLFGEPK